MSTALALDPARRPVLAPPALRPVAAPQAAPMARPRVLAAATLAAGTVAIVTAQLLLSIGTADGAYRLAELQHRSEVLDRRAQAQTEILASLAAPQHLAAAATALGMVPDDAPAYLDAATGAVRGSRSPARGTATAPGDLTH